MQTIDFPKNVPKIPGQITICLIYINHRGEQSGVIKNFQINHPWENLDVVKMHDDMVEVMKKYI